MNKQYNKNLIWLIKIILTLTTIFAVIIEIIFFPSLSNFVGCTMVLVSYLLFTKFFLKRELIKNAPFSFFMLLSMFLYRYLSLPTLILEGKPISYGMERPIKTFLLETFLFGISCLAFYCASKNINKNNFLQRFLNTIGFYKQGNTKTFWMLGVLGCIARILSLAMGQIETGNVIGRVLIVLFYYMYAPIILFFPCLYNNDTENNFDLKNKKIWTYVLFISILNFATNSRNQMITPFAIIILLLFISLIICNTSINSISKPSIVIKSLVIIIVGLNIMNSVSKSMLINRGIRDQLSFTELIETTFDTLLSKNMDELWNDYNNKFKAIAKYDEGWTEDYVDNYLLNRFCNIRITDETLYLSEKLNYYKNEVMLDDFKSRVISVLPLPIIDIIGMDFDKENYYNSRGDALYVYSGIGNISDWGGYRVTSHLGDGLSTFGVLYFPIQFIMWYFVMTLLNSYSINTNKKGRVYSVFGLLSCYSALLMFRNANGMIEDVLFCLRGYWQEVFIFLFIYKFVRFISIFKLRGN